MPYEIEHLLNKCNADDYNVFVGIIDNYLSATDDKKHRSELQAFQRSPSNENRIALNRHIEKDIRYFGSHDVAYAWRWLVGGDEPAGVGIDEVIGDVSGRLKVKQKPFGTTEAKLERLVAGAAEKAFFDLSPEQQRELFQKAGLSDEQQRTFFEQISKNKGMFLPGLLAILGPKLFQEVIMGIVASVLTGFLGRKAAVELLKQLAKRFPWWAEWLGPIVWVASAGWLAFDILGPAYRKTVPSLLYLGIVCLRDGPSDPSVFSSTVPEA